MRNAVVYAVGLIAALIVIAWLWGAGDLPLGTHWPFVAMVAYFYGWVARGFEARPCPKKTRQAE